MAAGNGGSPEEDSDPSLGLLGKTLRNGWTVAQIAHRTPKGTGGHFSVCFIVEREDGTKAFLKATDYSRALRSCDPAFYLHRQAEAFIFERRLLKECSGMSRVVRLLDHGSVRADARNPASVSQYLIFELADSDLRGFIERIRIATALALTRDVAVGLMQLHEAGIAHQDIKPSNILVFGETTRAKIGDLGRAVGMGVHGPHDSLDWPGDYTYAPPETLYGHIPDGWEDRRVSGDYFLLGSIILFALSEVSMTPMLLEQLPARHHPELWRKKFRAVLPHLKRSFASVLARIRGDFTERFGASVHERVCDEIMAMLRQLCHPEPEKRGFPDGFRHRSGRGRDIRPYVSSLTRLSKVARLQLLRSPTAGD